MPHTDDLISYGIIVLIGIFLIFTTSISSIEQITAQGSSEDSELTDQGSETDGQGGDDGGDDGDDDDGVDTPTVPGPAPGNDDSAQPRIPTPIEPGDPNGDGGDDGDDDDGVDTPTVPGPAPGDGGDNAGEPSRTTSPSEREDQESETETDEEGDEEATTTTATTISQSSDGDAGRIFRSTTDAFQVEVPEGWIIQDTNNTDSMLMTESTQGYEILAQLCREEEGGEEEEQREAALTNVGSGGNIYGNCGGSQEDITHIVRYSNLDARLQVPNNITSANNNNMTIDNVQLYYMQKLEDVGYSGMQIVNNTETTVDIINGRTNQTIATAPAKLIEYTYFYPGEGQTRIMYREFTLLVLNEDTGYALLYKDLASSLPSGRPPSQVQQIFDSFELL
jgi:hypothetical protein